MQAGRVKLPSRETLEYVRLILTTALLVLALPLLLIHYLKHPHDAAPILAGIAH